MTDAATPRPEECDHEGTDLPHYNYCPYCGTELGAGRDV